MTAKFVRIDEARCPNCGPKGAFRFKGREYPLPVTLDMAVVEQTPWRCGDCRNKIDLQVEVVE